MIDDVLKEIREAEAQADEIVSEAQNKAKQIVQQAEIDAEKQKKPLFCNAATTGASRLTKRKQTRKKSATKSSKKDKNPRTNLQWTTTLPQAKRQASFATLSLKNTVAKKKQSKNKLDCIIGL